MSRKSARGTLIEAAALLAGSCALAFSFNALSPSGLPLRSAWADYDAHHRNAPPTDLGRADDVAGGDDAGGGGSATGSAETTAPMDLVPWPIDLTEAARLHAEGAVFVDTRGREEFEALRVAGACSVDPDDMEALSRLAARARPESPVVLYCRPGCEDYRLVAYDLAARGFQRIYAFSDGVELWRAYGHPVESGPEETPPWAPR